MSETNRSTTTTALAPRADTAAVVPAAPAGFMAVTNFNQAMELANFIGKSALVPEAYRGKPADIVIAMQLGMELGLAPLQSLQSVAVINGRPSLWGDAMKGLVIGLPECEDFVEDEPQGDDAEKWVATCTIKRRNRTAVVRTFSWADAKAAGLAGKAGPWKQYPKRMLMLRARGFALRDAFPDRLRGIITAEEAQDFPAPAPVISEPRRVGASSTVDTTTSAPAVPPTETAPAGGAAATPPAPAASTPASSPVAAPSPSPSPTVTAPPPETVTGLQITNTEFSRTKNGDPLFTFTTTGGQFHTRSQEIYDELRQLEGTDHTVAITWVMGRLAGSTARVVKEFQVDEPQDQALVLDGGDQ